MMEKLVWDVFLWSEPYNGGRIDYFWDYEKKMFRVSIPDLTDGSRLTSGDTMEKSRRNAQRLIDAIHQMGGQAKRPRP